MVSWIRYILSIRETIFSLIDLDSGYEESSIDLTDQVSNQVPKEIPALSKKKKVSKVRICRFNTIKPFR